MPVSRFVLFLLFSCDQTALRTLLSVRPSVCLSDCHTIFSLCSSQRIITKFSGVITIDKNDVHAKDQGYKPKVKVVDVKTHFAPIWSFPDHNSSLNLQMATKWCTKVEVAQKSCPIVFLGHPSNFKVTRDTNLPIFIRIEQFRTITPVWIH